MAGTLVGLMALSPEKHEMDHGREARSAMAPGLHG